MKLTAMCPFGLKVVGGRVFIRAGQVIESDDFRPGTFDSMLEAGQVKVTEPEPAPLPPVEELAEESAEETE